MSQPTRAWLSLVMVCVMSVPMAAARGADATVSLASLEQRVAQAPGLIAGQRDIEAAQQAIRVERDRAGWNYQYNADFGPSAIIVPRSFDEHVLRFEHTFGLGLPLLGSKTAQLLTILDAQTKERLAEIAYEQARRLRIATLREAYVQYWEYDNESAVAQTYVGAVQAEIPKARALRQTGFWTYTNLLDFLDTVQRVQSDQRSFESLKRAQLATVQSAVGIEVPAFRPVQPEFYNACNVSRAGALTSAFAVDPTLATLTAEIVQVRTQLASVRGSSIAAAATGQAGSVTDINQKVSGYDLRAALNVSLPTHGRDEERALRDEYAAQLSSLSLQQEQRRVDIASSLDSVLADIESAQTTLAQAQQTEAARREDLRKSIIAYNTLRQGGATGFDQVHEKRDELYEAQKATAAARGDLLVKANQLLLVAPAACGKAYTPMPVFTMAPKPSPRPRGTHGPTPALFTHHAATPSPHPAATPSPRPASTLRPAPTAAPIPSPAPNPTPVSVPTPAPQPTLVPTPQPLPSAMPTLIPAPTPQPHPPAKTAQAQTTKSKPAPWMGAGYQGGLDWIGAGFRADQDLAPLQSRAPVKASPRYEWLGWGYSIDSAWFGAGYRADQKPGGGVAEK